MSWFLQKYHLGVDGVAILTLPYPQDSPRQSTSLPPPTPSLIMPLAALQEQETQNDMKSLYLLPRAIITKYHKLDGLKQ